MTVDYKLATRLDHDSLDRPDERSDFLLTLLNKAAAEEIFMLVDYEWTILPEEMIAITVVTEREKKEFSFHH